MRSQLILYGLVAPARPGVSCRLGWGKWRLVFPVVLVELLSPAMALAQPEVRRRISINDNRRFMQGDPPSNTVNLLYDIRQPQAVRHIATIETTMPKN